MGDIIDNGGRLINLCEDILSSVVPCFPTRTYTSLHGLHQMASGSVYQITKKLKDGYRQQKLPIKSVGRIIITDKHKKLNR